MKKNEVSEWAKEAVNWAKENNITDGSNLKENCTREEVITLIYRALNKPTWTQYIKLNDFDIIETTIDNIKIENINNKPLNKTGINGTFYAIDKPYIYGIAIQNNHPLEINSYVSNFNGYKRGTIWYDGKRCYIAKIYNSKHEIKTNINWAISGIELYPNYDPKREGFTGKYSDVLRATKHTAIGFKDNKVYLIVSNKNLTMLEFRNKLLNSKIAFDGLIALDGGGSSQMVYNGKEILKSSRPLNHGIFVVRLLSES